MQCQLSLMLKSLAAAAVSAVPVFLEGLIQRPVVRRLPDVYTLFLAWLRLSCTV